MGFFDRLVGKTSRKPAPRPVSPVAPAAAPVPPAAAPEPAPAAAAPSGNLLPQLAAARELLEKRDLAAARALYEEVLTVAGDRPDVLVTISGDLGSCGYLEPIVELIAPRYDAERHGPATGLNLLQAYLALRNPEAAQHVLDLLFDLRRADLEERLWGFSNAIAEQIEARKRSGTSGGGPALQVQLVTISKPIWWYGLESVADVLPEKAKGGRRVGFAQLSLLGLPDLEQRMRAPEDALTRFSRGLPLWLAEVLYFSSQYDTAGVIGVMGQSHYAVFGTEWSTENIRQLVETGGHFDFVVTGAVQETSGDVSLVLRLWEIKTFRQRKTFQYSWTPATADEVLRQLHDQLRTFFEWKPAPGLPYQAPASPTAWIHTLGASLSHFLVEKAVLPRTQLAPLPEPLASGAQHEAAALAHLSLAARARRLGTPTPPAPAELPATPRVEQARQLG